MQAFRSVAELAGRILIASLFVFSAIAKIRGYAGTVEYMQAYGLPGTLLPLVIGFELIAGVMVIAGWLPRATAATLATFCLVSALIFHFDPGNEGEQTHFLKNLALAGALACLALRRPGRTQFHLSPGGG